MSRIDITRTQELFQRLGATSQSRSVRADALFRRLREQEQDDVAKQLSKAPARLKLKRASAASEKADQLLKKSL